MEVMNETLHLVFRHIMSKHKTFDLEPQKEYFNSVGLNDINAENDSFALD